MRLFAQLKSEFPLFFRRAAQIAARETSQGAASLLLGFGFWSAGKAVSERSVATFSVITALRPQDKKELEAKRMQPSPSLG